MSIQEQSIQHDIPGQKSSSSMVINSGEQDYDPSEPTEDDDVNINENGQLNDSKHQTQEVIRINNGKSAHPVITNKDKAQSFEFNEQHQQQSSRHRNSPDYHSKTSDRRSKSPHRKHFRQSPTVTNETISSSKSKSSYRNDDRKNSKSYHRHRSTSNSSSSSTTNHKKPSDTKDDSVRSSKRDEHHSYRSKSSRNSHSDHRTNQSSLSLFNHTTNGSQRTRSNLIEIVTTESTLLQNRSEPTKSNSNKADDMLMEEMLLEEERKQNPIKSIDLDSLTIPESTKKPTNDTKQPINPPNSTSSPTKKPYYVLHKVPHTNHTTPPRQKKPQIQQPTIDDSSRRTSLEDRISTIFGVPSTKSTDTQPSISSVQILTPSDKSTESSQDIKSSTLIIKKTESDSNEKISLPDDKRSNKHYTTEWLASQKPEEAPVTEELPSPVSLPNLTSNQTSTNPESSSNKTDQLGKLTKLMEKFSQKQTNPTETDEAVPMSAKHLERMERRKQRENRQSEIAAIAKEALKPAFKKHTISKDEYKQIMKKVVTKATSANEIDRDRIRKMIDAYVEKYRHNNSKSRT